MLTQLRYAIRSLLKAPMSTALSVAALALGIGVNISCFISVEAMVLRGLPYPEVSRIVTLWENSHNLKDSRDALAPATFVDWKEQNRAFQQVGAYRMANLNLTGIGDPLRLQGCLATPGFFSVLGLKPQIGRVFSESAAGDADHVAVVSDGFWKRHLASDPNAIGASLTLDGTAYTVIGVMPDEFDYPLATDVWVPLILGPTELHTRTTHDLMAIARLSSGTSLQTAQAESNLVASRLERLHPDSNAGRGLAVALLRDSSNQITGRFVLILTIAAGFVLLLACANVSNILLARSMDRQRENAIKSALGAGRGEIVARLLTEAVVIGLGGGGLGLLLAAWNLQITKASIPAQVLHWVVGLKNMKIDAPTYAYSLALALLFGALCALPALLQLRHRPIEKNLTEVLRSGRSFGGLVGRDWLRGGIVVIEIVLSLVLLVGATLMIGAFRHLSTVDPGYDPKNIMVVDVSLPTAHYRTPDQVRSFYSQLLGGVEQIRESKASAVSGYAGDSEGLIIEGRTARPDDIKPDVYSISDRYFETMRLPVVQGRPLASSDGPTAPLAVVISQTVARYYWPGSSPLGRHFKLHSTDSQWLTVVGISGEMRNWFGGHLIPTVYRSYLQLPQQSMRLSVRTFGNPMEQARSVRRALTAVDPNESGYEIKTVEQILGEETSGVRIAARTMMVYAIIAFILAVTGIYAINSYMVAQRTYEIGIRVAMGADRSAILSLFLRRALLIATVGLGVGLVLSLLLSRIVASALEGIIELNPLLFAALIGALGCAALIAAYFPARRAATVDPNIVLRG